MTILRRTAAALVAMLTAAVVVIGLAAVPASAGRYTPGGGVTFNNAYGNKSQQNAILDKIIKSVRTTPKGEHIEVMSWNFNSRRAVRALVSAQKRGVRVRLIQARGNVAPRGGDSFAQLRAGLARGNKGKTGAERSWARACRASCRGRGGAAHAKFFLFSRAGRAKNVVIQGSANLTSTSGFNQWNDIQTLTNRAGPYDFMSKVFAQMAKDKPVRKTYVTWRDAPDQLAFFPGATGRRPDPVMQLLNQVRCRGAANTGNGRTRIRIAPDVIREERGMRLGRKVRSLWIRGCDVRVGYTVIGIDVGRMLRQGSKRGPVPLAHMVRDRNRDGQFDDYFHMKSVAITGNVGGKRKGYAVLNGSQNWSNASARSDENVGVFYRQGMTRQYSRHIDRWYRFFRARGANRYVFAREAEAQGRLDDGLLLGEGPINGVDPYALLETD